MRNLFSIRQSTKEGKDFWLIKDNSAELEGNIVVMLVLIIAIIAVSIIGLM